MTNTEKRRLGKYHGVKTVVVGIRMPAEMRDALLLKVANSDKATVSQYIESLIETEALRIR